MADVPLREHIESLIGALDRHLSGEIASARQASEAAQRVAEAAVSKAEKAVERRLKALNELRGMVVDYQHTLMPRAEAEQRFTAIDTKLNEVRDAVENRVAHSRGLADGWGYLVGAAGLVVGVIVAVIAVLG
jgi:hypothetical protein